MKNARMIKITEDLLLDSFRVYKGGHGNFLGVKSAWWVAHMDPNEIVEEAKGVFRWQPDSRQIYIAERVLIDIFPRLDSWNRKLIIDRCGTGFKKSYRKCAKLCGIHHEVFRQQFQSAMDKLQLLVDESAFFE